MNPSLDNVRSSRQRFPETARQRTTGKSLKNSPEHVTETVHLDQFKKKNAGDYPEEQGGRFHRDVSSFEKAIDGALHISGAPCVTINEIRSRKHSSFWLNYNARISLYQFSWAMNTLYQRCITACITACVLIRNYPLFFLKMSRKTSFFLIDLS